MPEEKKNRNATVQFVVVVKNVTPIEKQINFARLHNARGTAHRSQNDVNREIPFARMKNDEN